VQIGFPDRWSVCVDIDTKKEQLKMPRRQRVAVIILFSLGFLVTAAGSVRTYYVYESMVIEYDQTWYAYPLWIAAAIEIDLGVVS